MKELLCKHQSTMFAQNLSAVVSRCNNPQSEFFVSPLSPLICIKCPQREEVTQKDIAKHIAHVTELMGDTPVIDRLTNELLAEIQKKCLSCEHFYALNGLCRACNCAGSLLPITERVRLLDARCPLNKW